MSGAAYIFRRNSGVWTREQKLTASEGVGGDRFGSSISVSGTRCVVGAPYDDDAGTSSGSIYVYHWNGTSWIQYQKLTASDAESGDYFGKSVSIASDTIVAGAYKDDDNETDSGSAYVFYYNSVSNTWGQQQKLLEGYSHEDDYFGYSVCVSGNRIIAGAYQFSYENDRSGSAYIFEWDGTEWDEQQRISASEIKDSNQYGCSISMYEDTIVVGANLDADYGGRSGSAFIFSFTGGNWNYEQKITSEFPVANEEFGTSVSVYGDWIAVGAPGYEDEVGSVYMFQRMDGDWVFRQKLSPDESDIIAFGKSVAMYGSRLVIGAVGDYNHLGATFVFYKSGTTWSQEQKLTVPDLDIYDYYGGSVAIYGNYIVVGARGNTYNDIAGGSAYIYWWTGFSWVLDQEIQSDDAAEHDGFGNSVSIFESDVIVGADGDDDNGPGSGSVYMFHRDSGTWSQVQKINPDDWGSDEYFGNSVSIYGNRVCIGKFQDDEVGTTSGAAYIFKNTTGTWTQEYKIIGSDLEIDENFGSSVCFYNGRAAIGAAAHDTAYCYDGFDPVTPTPTATITPTATPAFTFTATPTPSALPSKTPVPTKTPTPVNTQPPTNTPTQTYTQLPSKTPAATKTPTPVNTQPPTDTPTPTPAPPTESPTPTCFNDGDVVDDAVITSGDSQRAFQIALGLYSPNHSESCSADCNGDGRVTSGDAQVIFNVVFGMDNCVDPI